MSRVDIDKARAMRAEGKTLAEIGAHFGVTHERIRQLVGTTELPPAQCDWCKAELPRRRTSRTRYCSRACSTSAWNATHGFTICACGERKAAGAKFCRSCHNARVSNEDGNRLIVELWNRGESISTIAAALDTTTNTLGVRISRLRSEGYDIPYRRRVWPGGVPANPELEVREYRPEPVSMLDLNTKEILARARQRDKERARSAFHAAEARGQVTRPDSCSRCGERTRIEAHHPDYAKPFDVEWLCFPCHRAHHIGERRAAA